MLLIQISSSLHDNKVATVERQSFGGEAILRRTRICDCYLRKFRLRKMYKLEKRPLTVANLIKACSAILRNWIAEDVSPDDEVCTFGARSSVRILCRE
ncbi:hypothetical protein NPIL_613061 [Nephila pilipes]|uniref:Uncharacterized protein n=1 Tax=Nephila pilipes TaxID=299642 RepID=A0A8X6QVS0_NEPPI|nr:hypothetical protein NPIL_613061 [Nephila pilipes]